MVYASTKTLIVKALIFGVNSQDGYYLKQVCEHNNVEVIGVSRSEGEWIRGSVADYGFVSQLIRQLLPEYIFHIAAKSTTRHAAIFENHETISTGSFNILEAVKNSSPYSHVFITGSGVQFVNEGRPIRETDPFFASSTYSVSRIQSVYAARYYRSLGIKAYVGYLFHHESPLRKPSHLSKLTTNTIKAILAGNIQKIEIGNLSVRKEWAFAEDIAKGIFVLVKQGDVYEACIGTGKAYSIEYWLEACFKYVGLNWKEFVTEKNDGFIPEYELLVSDPSTIKSLGWQAETNIDELVKKMMNIN
jgi:GDPmannose 4,6-dehydratase